MPKVIEKTTYLFDSVEYDFVGENKGVKCFQTWNYCNIIFTNNENEVLFKIESDLLEQKVINSIQKIN